MRSFPQLQTGAVAQHPIEKRFAARTVINETADERQVKIADDGAVQTGWFLVYRGLTDEEMEQLRRFFADCEGRLLDFVFLDPTDNLLVWSENLTESSWQRNPLLTVSGGAEDPWGAQRGWTITNTGGAPLRMEQYLTAPADRYYCFSAWLRSAAQTAVDLVRACPAASERRTFGLGTMWQRCLLSGRFEASDEIVSFGIEVRPGAAIEVAALQVEAQPGASGYKKTESRGGVHGSARFDMDSLAVETTAPNQHSVRIWLRSRG